jgi:hypothetical protein
MPPLADLIWEIQDCVKTLNGIMTLAKFEEGAELVVSFDVGKPLWGPLLRSIAIDHLSESDQLKVQKNPEVDIVSRPGPKGKSLDYAAGGIKICLADPGKDTLTVLDATAGPVERVKSGMFRHSARARIKPLGAAQTVPVSAHLEFQQLPLGMEFAANPTTQPVPLARATGVRPAQTFRSVPRESPNQRLYMSKDIPGFLADLFGRQLALHRGAWPRFEAQLAALLWLSGDYVVSGKSSLSVHLDDLLRAALADIQKLPLLREQLRQLHPAFHRDLDPYRFTRYQDFVAQLPCFDEISRIGKLPGITSMAKPLMFVCDCGKGEAMFCGTDQIWCALCKPEGGVPLESGHMPDGQALGMGMSIQSIGDGLQMQDTPADPQTVQRAERLIQVGRYLAKKRRARAASEEQSAKQKHKQWAVHILLEQDAIGPDSAVTEADVAKLVADIKAPEDFMVQMAAEFPSIRVIEPDGADRKFYVETAFVLKKEGAPDIEILALTPDSRLKVLGSKERGSIPLSSHLLKGSNRVAHDLCGYQLDGCLVEQLPRMSVLEYLLRQDNAVDDHLTGRDHQRLLEDRAMLIPTGAQSTAYNGPSMSTLIQRVLIEHGARGPNSAVSHQVIIANLARIMRAEYADTLDHPTVRMALRLNVGEKGGVGQYLHPLMKSGCIHRVGKRCQYCYWMRLLRPRRRTAICRRLVMADGRVSDVHIGGYRLQRFGHADHSTAAAGCAIQAVAHIGHGRAVSPVHREDALARDPVRERL